MSRAEARAFRWLRLASAAALVLITVVIVLGAGEVALPFGGFLWWVGVVASLFFALLHWTERGAMRVVGLLGALVGLAAMPLQHLDSDAWWARGAWALAGVLGVVTIVMDTGSRGARSLAGPIRH